MDVHSRNGWRSSSEVAPRTAVWYSRHKPDTMPQNESEALYQQAYSLHYRERKPAEAVLLYKQIVERFPGTQEAGYARTQIENIEGESQRLRAYVASLHDSQSDEERAAVAAEREKDRQAEERERPPVAVTTAPQLHNVRVLKTHDVITSECVFGVNVLRDMFAMITDVVGGRSESMQRVLRDARQTCLLELKREALRIGANAVIAVRLDYQEIAGHGKSMMLLVASGTAVTVEPDPGEDDLGRVSAL